MSKRGRANGLGVSLLQRLGALYRQHGDDASLFSVTLYSSHQCIRSSQLLFPVSKLFYESKLQALQNAKPLSNEPYPLKFVYTDNEPLSVSYIVDEVGKLLSHNRDDGLSPDDICIITTNQKQVSTQ